MAMTFPDPSQSPWTNPDTGVVYNWIDPPGTWVPEGEDEEYEKSGRISINRSAPVRYFSALTPLDN